MEFLKKYDPKHYKIYLPIVNKVIGDHTDLHRWIKSLGTNDILIWLKSIALLEQESHAFFEECTILVTLVIRLFCLELDIDYVELKNAEITKFLERLKSSLKKELAYRKDVIDTTPTFTLLKDIED